MPAPTETKTFFNVMPEVTSGPITTPKVQTVATEKSAVPPKPESQIGLAGATTGNNKNWKMIIIFVVIGFVLLVGIAIAAYYLFIKGDEAQDRPVEDTVSVIEDKPEVNPDVTTPGDWLNRYFESETCIELALCGDKADPDRDGLDNKAEFETSTDPNNPDSDSDGVSDGDETLVFMSDPLLLRTYRAGEYNDADFVKGGYDIQTNQPYTNEKLITVKTMIKQYGLHQPTLSTLGTLSFQLYEFTDPSIPPLPADLDVSPQAKLDRDSQRQSTIKKVGFALLEYQKEKKSYPPTDDFVVMADMVRPYNTVATNYNDPVAREPYVYGYQATNNNADFVLTYYSETQNQLIKYFARNAQEDALKDNGKVNDEQRKLDIENIRQALLVYSNTQLDPESLKEFVFPTEELYKTVLTPLYMKTVPVDPITKLDYQYTVGPNFDTFVLKAPLQAPAGGSTGYMCTETECKNY